jgi:hypothetical protein
MLLAVYVFKAVTQNLRGITMAYPNTQQTKAIPFFARFLSVDKKKLRHLNPLILNPLLFGLGSGPLTGKTVN